MKIFNLIKITNGESTLHLGLTDEELEKFAIDDKIVQVEKLGKVRIPSIDQEPTVGNPK